MHVMWRMMDADPALKHQKLAPGLVRRVAGYALPYRTKLIGFMITVIAQALLGIVAPLLFRRIIDHTLPNRDTGELTWIALAVIGAEVIGAVLSLFERKWSSQIGEGLIYDLRSQLFDHVQRLPISFFTRTQTGALVSRLNNDVIGAQRAFTGTLGTVVSNVITLVTTLIAMAALEWRLTILAVLLLPIFLVPAKRVGRRLAEISRDGMNLNAEMNNTMTERFGVAGALLVKSYGRPDEEAADFSGRAARVRDIGVRSAMFTRVFLATLGLVGSIATAAVYWFGGRQVISGAITAGTLVALAAFVVRIYEPLTSLTNARVDVMSAFVSFERVFEVLDTPNPIQDAPDAIVLPSPRATSSSTTSRSGTPSPRTPWHRSRAGTCPRPTVTSTCSATSPCVSKRVRWWPWSDPRAPASRRWRHWSAATTTRPRAPSSSTVTTSGRSPSSRCAMPSEWLPRTRTSSTRRSARTCATPDPAPPMPSYAKPAVPPRCSRSSNGCPTGSTPWSASGATGSPAVRSSASQSPACSSRIRRS